MPSTVTPEKLKQPMGELEPSLFPDADIDRRLDAYIADGESRGVALSGATLDSFVTAWACYRFYKALVLQKAGDPLEETFDSGKSRYKFSEVQIEEFKLERDRWLSVCNGLLPSVVSSSSTAVTQRSNRPLLCSICGMSTCSHYQRATC